MIRRLVQVLAVLIVIALVLQAVTTLLAPLVGPALILLVLLGIGVVTFGGRWSS